MKLDLTRWREALRSVETELKQLKKEQRQHREPGTSFDTGPLLLAKARASRLYCLRRHLKGQLHTTGRLQRIAVTSSGITYTLSHAVTDLPSQEALLHSVSGWMDSLVIAVQATG
ncbi:MAG: hypothetical protein JNM17_24505 [Archangium sp.]|nr:hypothetical protein [Archangium sp.]